MPSFHSLKRKFYLSFFILLPCEQKLPFHDMYWLAKKVSSTNNYSIFHHSSASFIIWFMSINKWQLCLLLALIPQSFTTVKAGRVSAVWNTNYCMGIITKRFLFHYGWQITWYRAITFFLGIIPWSIFFGHMSFGGSFFSMPEKLKRVIRPFYGVLFAYYFFIFACHWHFFFPHLMILPFTCK